MLLFFHTKGKERGIGPDFEEGGDFCISPKGAESTSHKESVSRNEIGSSRLLKKGGRACAPAAT